MKKRYYETRTDTVDHQTGEVVSEQKTHVALFDQEPPYVKLYFKDVARITGLPSGAATFLHLIISKMGYGNLFVAYMPIKKELARESGLTIKTINKKIDELYKAGILIRKDRGVYLIDPNLFARGKWSDIKNLQLIVNYNPETGKRELNSNAYDELKKMRYVES